MAALPLAKLRFGNIVQLEATQGTRTRCRTQLLGALPGHSVMVTAPDPGIHAFAEGDSLVVRIFTGEEALAFRAGVTRVCRQPFPYLHLTYPQAFEKALARNARRARLSLSARATAGGPPVDVLIHNLSIEGAQVEAGEELGPVGTRIELSASLQLDRIGERPVTLPADIRNLRRHESDGKAVFRYGLQFVDPPLESELALAAFVYRELVAAAP
jgi:hypothetical protein